MHRRSRGSDDPLQGSFVTGPPKYRAERVAAVAVLALGLIAGGRYAIEAKLASEEIVSSQSLTSARGLFRQSQCVGDSLLMNVSAGSSVYVDETDALWHQRLSELASPNLRVMSAPDDAAFLISTQEVPPDQGCSGIRLLVEPR